MPFVHQATGWAALALQPDPLVAGMLVVTRQIATVSGGVPQAGDARVVSQGVLAWLPLPGLAEACGRR
jgi:hypothetical protein